MPRLSALDLAFFLLETRERPMNVGPLLILKPPPGFKGNFAGKLLAQMRKVPPGPPFNYRLRSTAPMAIPALEVAPDVDIAQHVHRATLPAPGTQEALLEMVCALHPQRLDRTRPLWELHVIDGLEGGRVALYGKVHHGIIDGAGFVKVISNWLSATPGDRKARAMWEGLPPSATRPRGDSLAATARKLAGNAIGAAGSLAALGTLLARQGLKTAGLGRGLALPFVATPDTFRAEPSPLRSFAYAPLPLPALKALGEAHGATVNDVLLAVIDIALAQFLEQRGEAPHKPLIADMPIALPAAAGGGNRIAIVQIPLGMAGAAPLQRLAAIRAEADAVKNQLRELPSGAAMLYTALTHALPSLFEAMHLNRAPMLANMVISNPFGFPGKRYLMGAEVEVALPISVIAHGQTLNITATTYGAELQVAFMGVAEAMPDIGALAACLTTAFAELQHESHATLATTRPARPRTRGTRRAAKARAA